MTNGLLKIKDISGEISIDGDKDSIIEEASKIMKNVSDSFTRNCLVDGQFMALYSFTTDNDELLAELFIK